jgi:DNA-binding response OmpR family regulator
LHLIVTDIVMPRMSGIQVAEAVQRKHPGARVLFVSGYMAEHSGAVDLADIELLGKPYTPASLLARVRALLDRPEPRADH